MPIPTQCTQCRQSMNLPEIALGRNILCLACRHVFVLTAEAPRPTSVPLWVEGLMAAEAEKARPEEVVSRSESAAPRQTAEPLRVKTLGAAKAATQPPEVVVS